MRLVLALVLALVLFLGGCELRGYDPSMCRAQGFTDCPPGAQAADGAPSYSGPTPRRRPRSNLARRVHAVCAPRAVFDWQLDPLNPRAVIVWCLNPKRPSVTDSHTIPRYVR